MNEPLLIDLSALALGEHSFDYELLTPYFERIVGSEVLSGKVSAHADLVLREQDFDLRVRIDGVVQVVCDRCLEPMDVALSVQDDMDLDEETNTLDLEWLAYELVIVNLPLVHRHQDGGCNPQMAALLQDHLCTSEEDEEIDESDL